MLLRVLFTVILILSSFFLAPGYAEEVRQGVAERDHNSIPNDFTRFNFQGHDE